MKVLLFLLFVVITGTASAQFFGRLKPLAQPKQSRTVGRNIALSPVVTATDSTFWGLRPIVTAATGFIGGTVKAMAGTGISYQNLTYNYATGKYYANYAISALVFAGGSVIPTKPTDVMSAGIMLSFLNNTVGVGAFGGNVASSPTDDKKFKIGFMTTYTINFNN